MLEKRKFSGISRPLYVQKKMPGSEKLRILDAFWEALSLIEYVEGDEDKENIPPVL